MRRSRDDADNKTQNRAARDRHRGLAPFLFGRQQVAQARGDDVLHRVGAWRRQDFAEPEQPDRDRHNANTIAQFRKIEAIAEMAGHIVNADHAKQQPEASHQQCPDQRGRRHIGKENEAEHEKGGVFRRSKPHGERCERRRDNSKHQHAERAADPRANRCNAKRGAGAAFLGHGIAVDAGHHRRCLAGNAHQDRCGGAAILRAVIDTGEHDDRLRGVQTEGHRQQDGDARERTDARQHADERANQATEKRVPRVGRQQGDREAEIQTMKSCFHGNPRIRTARIRAVF